MQAPKFRQGINSFSKCSNRRGVLIIIVITVGQLIIILLRRLICTVQRVGKMSAAPKGMIAENTVYVYEIGGRLFPSTVVPFLLHHRMDMSDNVRRFIAIFKHR